MLMILIVRWWKPSVHWAQPSDSGDEQSVAPDPKAVSIQACASRGNHQVQLDVLRGTIGAGSLC
jgi:hypothetical protein